MAEINAGGELVRLAENIAARERAEQLADLVADESPRFFEALMHICKRRLGLDKPSPVQREMTLEEAETFEREKFPVCYVGGRRVLDVSTEAVAWWLDDDDFTRRLRMYAQSPRYRYRQQIEQNSRPDWLKD